jgi:NAD(P)H-flavin reductase
MKARLIESTEIAPDVRHFVFAVPEVPSLDFTPGQFVSFTEPFQGKAVTRAYSIASAPEGNRFELCLNRVEGGTFSPYLFTLDPGGEVEMRGPLGYFTPKQPFRDSVFIATGTGIAPFRGFMRSAAVAESDAAITLLFGTRHEASILYRDEFAQFERNRPGFRFLPTLTRPSDTWPGRTGRVQQHLDEVLDGRTGVDVYICGLKAMVDDVRALLKARGFDRKQIIAEKYD